MTTTDQKRHWRLTSVEVAVILALVAVNVVLLWPVLFPRVYGNHARPRKTDLLISTWIQAAITSGQQTGKSVESVAQIREVFLRDNDSPDLYETRIELDGWGRAFRLEVRKTTAGTVFEIQSAGSNGVFDDWGDHAWYVVIGNDGKEQDSGPKYYENSATPLSHR